MSASTAFLGGKISDDEEKREFEEVWLHRLPGFDFDTSEDDFIVDDRITLEDKLAKTYPASVWKDDPEDYYPSYHRRYEYRILPPSKPGDESWGQPFRFQRRPRRLWTTDSYWKWRRKKKTDSQRVPLFAKDFTYKPSDSEQEHDDVRANTCPPLSKVYDDDDGGTFTDEGQGDHGADKEASLGPMQWEWLYTPDDCSKKEGFNTRKAAWNPSVPAHFDDDDDDDHDGEDVIDTNPSLLKIGSKKVSEEDFNLTELAHEKPGFNWWQPRPRPQTQIWVKYPADINQRLESARLASVRYVRMEASASLGDYIPKGPWAEDEDEQEIQKPQRGPIPGLVQHLDDTKPGPGRVGIPVAAACQRSHNLNHHHSESSIGNSSSSLSSLPSSSLSCLFIFDLRRRRHYDGRLVEMRRRMNEKSKHLDDDEQEEEEGSSEEWMPKELVPTSERLIKRDHYLLVGRKKKKKNTHAIHQLNDFVTGIADIEEDENRCADAQAHSGGALSSSSSSSSSASSYFQIRAVPVSLANDPRIHDPFQDAPFEKIGYPSRCFPHYGQHPLVERCFWKGVCALMFGQWATAVRHFQEAVARSKKEFRYRQYLILALAQSYMFDQVIQEANELYHLYDLRNVDPRNPNPKDIKFMAPPGFRNWAEFHTSFRRVVTQNHPELKEKLYSYVMKNCSGDTDELDHHHPIGSLFDPSLSVLFRARFNASEYESKPAPDPRPRPSPLYRWEGEQRYAWQRNQEDARMRKPVVLGLDHKAKPVVTHRVEGARGFITPSGKLILPIPPKTPSREAPSNQKREDVKKDQQKLSSLKTANKMQSALMKDIQPDKENEKAVFKQEYDDGDPFEDFGDALPGFGMRHAA